MRLDDLKPAEGATRRRKQVGRGPGSGHGKTSGRGHKGDKARGASKLGFEGGQTPLHRRLPKQRGVGKTAMGFRAEAFRTHYALVKLGDLNRFEAGSTVTPETLIEARVINEVRDGVKILGDGKLTKALTVRAHKFSKSAQEAITGLGGAAETL
jgi:large subunit ribosomal protein L15